MKEGNNLKKLEGLLNDSKNGTAMVKSADFMLRFLLGETGNPLADLYAFVRKECKTHEKTIAFMDKMFTECLKAIKGGKINDWGLVDAHCFLDEAPGWRHNEDAYNVIRIGELLNCDNDNCWDRDCWETRKGLCIDDAKGNRPKIILSKAEKKVKRIKK